jgi:uncharacterized protein (TIGR01319 family)
VLNHEILNDHGKSPPHSEGVSFVKVYLLVDFGSTYTKVTAVDLDTETVIGRAQSPTTVETDISIGLSKALIELRCSSGFYEDEVCGRYASSSAAGGLKMAAIGLVPELTLSAARRAALGAGAKVVGAYGHEIDNAIIKEIEEKRCDIIMLCGGTDGGNKKVILHNADRLAKSQIDCPVLICGNRVVSEQISEILERAGKRVYVTKNVLPSVNEIDIEPAQSQVREIFIEHIIKAKGLDKAMDYFDKAVMPTPKASLIAAELLADGTEYEPGIGSLLVVEVGGATTNIHSVTDIIPFTQQTVVRGLPESRVSRTVEGDLGIRYNARTIFDFVGAEHLKFLSEQIASSSDSCDPDEYTCLLTECVEYVPQNLEEGLMDIALATSAVSIAVERHAGRLKTEFSAIGEIHIQYGKNLFDVKNVLGTGGIFKYGVRPEAILEATLFSEQTPWSLKPRSPKAYLDADYLLCAMGLLSQEHPDAALRIMKKHLKEAAI